MSRMAVDSVFEGEFNEIELLSSQCLYSQAMWKLENLLSKLFSSHMSASSSISDQIRALELRAVIHSIQNKFEDAVNDLTIALQVSMDGSDEILIKRAEYFFRMGRIDQSFVDFQRAIQLNPYNARIYQSLGKIYVADNKMDAALDCFSKMIAVEPSASTFIERGCHLEKMVLQSIQISSERDLRVEALSDFVTAMGLRLESSIQDDLKSTAGAVRMLRVIGEYEESRRIASNGLERNFQIASLDDSYSVKTIEEIRLLMIELLVEISETSLHLRDRVSMYSFSNQALESLQLVPKSAESIQLRVRAHICRANHALQNNRLSQSLSECSLIFQLGFENQPAQLQFKCLDICGATLTRMRQFNQARACFERAMVLFPGSQYMKGKLDSLMMALSSESAQNVYVDEMNAQVQKAL